MPWPWQPLHHVFRAFDDLAPEQARIETDRMLEGFRRELMGEAIIFGAMAAGLVGVVPCGAAMVIQYGRSGGVLFPGLIILAVASAVGYIAGTWRWQRVAAIVLESRLGAGGDRQWNICASCRYSLNGLPHDEGRVVCPECGHVQLGSEWREIGSPNPTNNHAVPHTESDVSPKHSRGQT